MALSGGFSYPKTPFLLIGVAFSKGHWGKVYCEWFNFIDYERWPYRQKSDRWAPRICEAMLARFGFLWPPSLCSGLFFCLWLASQIFPGAVGGKYKVLIKVKWTKYYMSSSTFPGACGGGIQLKKIMRK